MDITIQKLLQYRNSGSAISVVKCTPDEIVSKVVEKIVKADVHRIVVVDDRDRVLGVISLSDILSFLVLRPAGMERKVVDKKILLIPPPHPLLEESEEGAE